MDRIELCFAGIFSALAVCVFWFVAVTTFI